MSFLFDDGSNEGFRVDSTPVTAAPLTMCCWFQTDDLGNEGCLLWIGDKDVNGHGWQLIANGAVGGDPIQFVALPDSGTAATSSGMSLNTWHHAAAVTSSATSRDVFIDGGSKGSDTTSSVPAGSDRFAIGFRARSSPVLYHSGLIAEAAVWNVALTEAEIAWLAKGYSPYSLVHRLANLVIYHDLIRDSDRPYIGANMTTVATPVISAHSRVFNIALQTMSPTAPITFVPHTVII
jgi:hypothetical protein